MSRARSLSAVVLLSSWGCGGEPPPRSQPPPPPELAAPRPSATPAASLAPPAAAPPPAPGLERRVVIVGESQQLTVALDVPAEWGTGATSYRGWPEVRLCREVIGASIELSSGGGNVPLQLKLAYSEDALGKAKREKPRPDREWVIQDYAGGGGERTIDARLFVDVPRGERFVQCAFGPLQGKALALLEKLKAACETLSFPDSVPPTPPVAARPTSADLEPPSDPGEKEAANLGFRFIAALRKGDAKEFRALLAGPEACAGDPPNKRAACVAALEAARREGGASMIAQMPADFQPGSVEAKGIRGPLAPKGGDAYFVSVHRSGDECAKGLSLMVVKYGPHFAVFPGPRLDGRPR